MMIKQSAPLYAGGPKVFPLVFGSLTLAQRSLSVAQSTALLQYAHECGINLCDTAEYYQNYPLLKPALAACPGLMVCTKTYAYDRAGALAAYDKAAEALGRPLIDIFLLHEQESEHTLRGHAEALHTLAELKAQGKIGAVGLSTHHVAAVRAACRCPQIEVVHPIFNQSGLGIVDGTTQDMADALSEAAACGIGIYAMKALGGGHLLGQAVQALRFVWNNPHVGAVAVGMQYREEIDFNLAILRGENPPSLTDKPRQLLVEDWCRGCGACVRRCGFGAMRLREGRAQPTEGCTCCGYCAKVCPEFCIKVI